MLVVYLRIKNITYMNKFTLLMIWCLVVGTLVSCSKDAADPAPVVAAEQDYMPSTKNSTWSYGGDSPYTVTATGATKVVNGKTYYEMEKKVGTTTSKSYLLKDKGVYTGIGMVSDASGIGMVSDAGSLEMTILKDAAPVGESWEQTSTSNGISTKWKFVIVEKGISKTVAGKTYTNVIHVKKEDTYSFMGEDMPFVLTTNYYFSKGVGIILTDFDTSDFDTQVEPVPLLSYDVK
jgi:hypothetical protein